MVFRLQLPSAPAPPLNRFLRPSFVPNAVTLVDGIKEVGFRVDLLVGYGNHTFTP